ncbi:MAG: molecular chaperone TorD family protein [Smithellaceae bacterium]
MTDWKEVNKAERELQRSVAASDMYRVLFIALHFPTDELASGLLDGSFSHDVMSIFEELNFPAQESGKIRTQLNALSGDKKNKEQLLTEMRREYTRLFTHPKKPVIAIYETTFLYNPEDELQSKPSLFISPAARDAERCYKKAGLEMSREINEPADHIATQMEFMMYLYLQKAKSIRNGNREELATRDDEIREFLQAHLQKWAKNFFDMCISSSQADFYKVIGEIGSLCMARMLVVE